MAGFFHRLAEAASYYVDRVIPRSLAVGTYRLAEKAITAGAEMLANKENKTKSDTITAKLLLQGAKWLYNDPLKTPQQIYEENLEKGIHAYAEWMYKDPERIKNEDALTNTTARLLNVVYGNNEDKIQAHFKKMRGGAVFQRYIDLKTVDDLCEGLGIEKPNAKGDIYGVFSGLDSSAVSKVVSYASCLTDERAVSTLENVFNAVPGSEVKVEETVDVFDLSELRSAPKSRPGSLRMVGPTYELLDKIGDKYHVIMEEFGKAVRAKANGEEGISYNVLLNIVNAKSGHNLLNVSDEQKKALRELRFLVPANESIGINYKDIAQATAYKAITEQLQSGSIDWKVLPGVINDIFGRDEYSSARKRIINECFYKFLDNHLTNGTLVGDYARAERELLSGMGILSRDVFDKEKIFDMIKSKYTEDGSSTFAARINEVDAKLRELQGNEKFLSWRLGESETHSYTPEQRLELQNKLYFIRKEIGRLTSDICELEHNYHDWKMHDSLNPQNLRLRGFEEHFNLNGNSKPARKTRQLSLAA